MPTENIITNFRIFCRNFNLKVFVIPFEIIEPKHFVICNVGLYRFYGILYNLKY
jgi:hypothetical protein